jgi:hypothetical protein
VHDREQLEESHRSCEVAFGEMMGIYQKQLEEAPRRAEEAKQEIRHQIETRNKFKEQLDAKYGFRS